MKRETKHQIRKVNSFDAKKANQSSSNKNKFNSETSFKNEMTLKVKKAFESIFGIIIEKFN